VSILLRLHGTIGAVPETIDNDVTLPNKDKGWSFMLIAKVEEAVDKR